MTVTDWVTGALVARGRTWITLARTVVAPVAVAGRGEVERADVAPAMSGPLRIHW